MPDHKGLDMTARTKDSRMSMESESSLLTRLHGEGGPGGNLAGGKSRNGKGKLHIGGRYGGGTSRSVWSWWYVGTNDAERGHPKKTQGGFRWKGNPTDVTKDRNSHMQITQHIHIYIHIYMYIYAL